MYYLIRRRCHGFEQSWRLRRKKGITPSLGYVNTSHLYFYICVNRPCRWLSGSGSRGVPLRLLLKYSVYGEVTEQGLCVRVSMVILAIGTHRWTSRTVFTMKAVGNIRGT